MKKRVVTFKVGEDEFCIEIDRVKEIQGIVDIVRIPKSPHFIEGIINLRGNVVPIINLRKRFGFSPKPFDEDTGILMIETKEKVVGFIADKVIGIFDTTVDKIEKPPAVISEDLFRGAGEVNGKLIFLLDIEKILKIREH